ncbi:MAG: hypothetical protein ACJ756_05405 [Solirubrobacterales bacterium]
MRKDYWLTVRTGPKVARERFDTLDDALEELEARAARLTLRPRRETIDVKVRQFSPEAQVAARLEVAGPGRFLPAKRGGVDVRGDGSVQAYVGGVRKRPLKAKGRTAPFEVLRQTLGVRP